VAKVTFSDNFHNRYVYVIDDPINSADPSGLNPGACKADVASICSREGIPTGVGCTLDGVDSDCGSVLQLILAGATNVEPTFASSDPSGGEFLVYLPSDCISQTTTPTDPNQLKPGSSNLGCDSGQYALLGGLPGSGTGGNTSGGGASKAGCFVKGVTHGAIGGLVVAGGTVLASTVLAPEVVTAGLLAAGAYGGYQLYQSIKTNINGGNQAGLAYSLGTLVGGAAVGGATSYGVRFSITGETGGPTGLLDFSGLTKLTNPFRAGNSVLGNLRAAFAKGPDLLGGGAAIAGGAGYAQGGCQ
jgi:hypothetical protein